MKNAFAFRGTFQVLCAIGLAGTVGISFSQSPEEQARRRNEEIRLQEEEAARKRRAQEEAAAARARDQEFNQNMQDAQRRQQDALKQSSGVSEKLEQARQAWLKRPPLPPDRNPVLGRWTRPSSSRTNSNDPFAGVQALVQGGLCELFFGGGVFEFRPDRWVGMDARTPEMELDRVEYRGDSKRVIVIPKTTFKLIEFDVEGPDRINWASQNCVLVRVGAAGSATASKPGQAESQRAASGSGGVLVLSVGEALNDNKAARGFLILNQDPQVTLIRAGLKQTPDGSVLQNWVRACYNRTPNCEKGAQALRSHSVGTAMADATGRAQTAALPAGRYWVYGDAKIGGKRLMWSEPVDVKPGTQSLTLDQRNAMPLD